MARRTSAAERFGDTLRAVRTKIGWSQTELAARLGYVPRTVNRWEQGHRLPDAAKKTHLVLHVARIDPDGARILARAANIEHVLSTGVPSPSPPAKPVSAGTIDAVVRAEAEKLDVTSAALRSALAAVLREARAQSVSVEMLASVVASKGR
jgi:transcriptional regulator with XRE-family HTH domain